MEQWKEQMGRDLSRRMGSEIEEKFVVSASNRSVMDGRGKFSRLCDRTLSIRSRIYPGLDSKILEKKTQEGNDYHRWWSKCGQYLPPSLLPWFSSSVELMILFDLNWQSTNWTFMTSMHFHDRISLHWFFHYFFFFFFIFLRFDFCKMKRDVETVKRI